MAISKTQPMRPAEIELVELVNQLESDLDTAELAISAETTARENADTQLGLRISANGRSIADIESALDSLPVFEYGASATLEIPAGSNVATTISFATEKENAPLVFVSLETPSDTISGTHFDFEYYDVSTEGFHVIVFNPNELVAATVKINWLAIGD